jgi:hypothetical protein
MDTAPKAMHTALSCGLDILSPSHPTMGVRTNVPKERRPTKKAAIGRLLSALRPPPCKNQITIGAMRKDMPECTVLRKPVARIKSQ